MKRRKKKRRGRYNSQYFVGQKENKAGIMIGHKNVQMMNKSDLTRSQNKKEKTRLCFETIKICFQMFFFSSKPLLFNDRSVEIDP